MLHGVADLARIASRVAGRLVRPTELGVLRSGLRVVERVPSWLAEAPLGHRLAALSEETRPPTEFVALLTAALPDELPNREDAGPLFRPGHAPEVDPVARLGARGPEGANRARALGTGRVGDQDAQDRLQPGLRVLLRGHASAPPPSPLPLPPSPDGRPGRAVHLRTGSRNSSTGSSTAREQAGAAEATNWEEFLGQVDHWVPAIHRVARAVGELDALATFAHLAQTRGYVRPVVEDSTALVIREGRHPVLERASGTAFVPNDTELDPEHGRMVVLTGPNMSGKSTYMRQVGLLVVLAQAVPTFPSSTRGWAS